jgi:hypothetical protein
MNDLRVSQGQVPTVTRDKSLTTEFKFTASHGGPGPLASSSLRLQVSRRLSCGGRGGHQLVPGTQAGRRRPLALRLSAGPGTDDASDSRLCPSQVPFTDAH